MFTSSFLTSFTLTYVLMLIIIPLLYSFRSSRPEAFCKKDALRNFTKFTGKRPRLAPLLKKRLWHLCYWTLLVAAFAFKKKTEVGIHRLAVYNLKLTQTNDLNCFKSVFGIQFWQIFWHRAALKQHKKSI